MVSLSWSLVYRITTLRFQRSSLSSERRLVRQSVALNSNSCRHWSHSIQNVDWARVITAVPFLYQNIPRTRFNSMGYPRLSISYTERYQEWSFGPEASLCRAHVCNYFNPRMEGIWWYLDRCDLSCVTQAHQQSMLLKLMSLLAKIRRKLEPSCSVSTNPSHLLKESSQTLISPLSLFARQRYLSMNGDIDLLNVVSHPSPKWRSSPCRVDHLQSVGNVPHLWYWLIFEGQRRTRVIIRLRFKVRSYQRYSVLISPLGYLKELSSLRHKFEIEEERCFREYVE